jgi:hypothetical protein
VRAPGLCHVGELLRLARERIGQLRDSRQQLVGRSIERRQVHSRREHVVRGLAQVDVVVGVHAPTGQGRDHLVGVHVRRGARAGLEHVDRELVVVLSGRDRIRRRGDPLGQALVEQPQRRVHPRGGTLDPAQPMHHRNRDRLARDREVVDRLASLPAPKLCHVAALLVSLSVSGSA